MSLIETYNAMQKEAQEVESEKVASSQEQEVANEEMEILNKYAEWAEEVLLNEAGEGNYTAEDVEKLATVKIEEDAAELEQREKVAEAYEMGQIMYEGFKAAAEADEN
jgi:hypothetical protein